MSRHPTNAPTEQIFKLEFHPINGPERRIRFLVKPGDDNILRVTEERIQGEWRQIDVETIDYFEYSDGP